MHKSSQVKPKVLLIHHGCELYGSDRMFLRLVSIMSKSVIPVIVLGGNGPLVEKLRVYTDELHFIELGVLRRKNLSHRGILMTLWQLIHSVNQIVKIIRHDQIECVYSNTASVFDGAVAAFITRRPHVWYVHEIIERPEFMRWFVGTMTHFLADEVICVSHAARKALLLPIGWSNAHIRVIHNFVDPVTVADGERARLRQEFGIEDDTFVIGMVGRIHEWKGQDVLVEALAKFREMCSVDFKAIVVGDVFTGNEYLKVELQEQIAKSYLDDHIVLTGFRDDAAKIMYAFDVSIVASTWPEPFGLVAIEAMHASKPVVATAHGGSLEIVEHGKTGLLVNPSDANMLALALAYLAQNPERALSYGEAGKHRVERLFSRTCYEDALLQHLQRILPTSRIQQTTYDSSVKEALR